MKIPETFLQFPSRRPRCRRRKCFVCREILIREHAYRETPTREPVFRETRIRERVYQEIRTRELSFLRTRIRELVSREIRIRELSFQGIPIPEPSWLAS